MSLGAYERLLNDETHALEEAALSVVRLVQTRRRIKQIGGQYHVDVPEPREFVALQDTLLQEVRNSLHGSRSRKGSRSPERRNVVPLHASSLTPARSRKASTSPERRNARPLHASSTSPARRVQRPSAHAAMDALLAACAKGDVHRVKNILRRRDCATLVYGVERDMQRTSLHIAACHGHLGTCVALVEHSADMQARERNGATPLLLGALYGHLQVVAWMCAQSADPAQRDFKGRNCFHCACWCAQPQVPEFIAYHFPAIMATTDTSGRKLGS